MTLSRGWWAIIAFVVIIWLVMFPCRVLLQWHSSVLAKNSNYRNVRRRRFAFRSPAAPLKDTQARFE